MQVGHYEPRKVEKGFEETILDVPEGEIYWLVKIDKGVHMDVKEQIQAELLSRLVRIETKLDKLSKKIVEIQKR